MADGAARGGDSAFSAIRPIDLAECAETRALREDFKPRVRDALLSLRRTYPQIPSEPRRIDAIAVELFREVSALASRTGLTMLTLGDCLADLEVKGLGQANEIWPWLFAMSSDESADPRAIDVKGSARGVLSQWLRFHLRGYFKGRRAALEWAIAATIAWRPASLLDLHGRIRKFGSPFLDYDAFRRYWGPYFTFGSDVAEIGDENEASPDWSLYWGLEPQTAYGGGYPGSVKNFLLDVFTDVRKVDPAADILDIGTGNHGATSIARGVSSHFGLYGIDPAPVVAPSGDTRIHAVRMKAEALAFPGNTFSAVVSVNGIEYAEPEAALTEMFRVMRPGAVGALVVHRPDSIVVGHGKKLVEWLELNPVMETLAMAWMAIEHCDDFMRREVERQISRLEGIAIEGGNTAFVDNLWGRIRAAIRRPRAGSGAAQEVIEWCERVLHWMHRKNRFLAMRIERIAANRDQVRKWLLPYGFEVDAIDDLASDASASESPVGWAVRLHKPE